MINLRDHVPGRYSFQPLGNGVVMHCDPCGKLTPADRINGPHWASVAGLADTLAWVTWHELTTDHGDERTPIADSIVGNHHHHFDGPLCTDPDDSPDTALFGVLLGHGRDASIWAYNDMHAANIISGKLGGVVVALPVLADHRTAGQPDNPVSKLAGHRAEFGPCPKTHPEHGECLAFRGHTPRRHMNEHGTEWGDDLHVSRETSEDQKRHNAAADRFVGLLGQALSGALGVPIRVVDEATGRETEYGPHSPIQPAGEPTPADQLGEMLEEMLGEMLGEPTPAEPAGEQLGPLVKLGDIPGGGFLAGVAEHIPASQLRDDDDDQADDGDREQADAAVS